MKRMMHILLVVTMLLMAWSFTACERTPVEGLPELSVSIQIPDMGTTKAETGRVGATDSEKKFTSLQFWVFFHGGDNDGKLVGYKGLNAAQLANTGLTHSAITRFGMPLSPKIFEDLSQEGTTVDVYAVANVASVVVESLGNWTTRSELEALVVSDAIYPTFGASPLTMAVPDFGLPMSGVLKGATVTGDYPVLNISTVTLTRAVSKIRFVFCQQGTPATDTSPAVPDKSTCVIKSISFGGVDEDRGHDCQIAASEKLFTNQKYPGTENLFDISGYTPLSTVIAGEPLIPNADISVCEYPDQLLFRSRGHETETAREYESRLDEAVGASSQVGPIYIRETDKLISGTITYNTTGREEDDLTVTFSMEAEDGNVLSRNHSWILYAYFAEATKTLQFKIVVLPWDKETYDYGYEAQTVNVVRRFTIPESDKYTKYKTDDGYYDIYFWHTVDGQPNVIKGDIIIATPVGQTIHVVPVAGVKDNYTQIDNIFTVTPEFEVIYPNYQKPEGGTTEDCRIEFSVQCNPGTHTPEELEGNYIDLHFCVRIGEGDNARWIDLDSESIDYYRIYLKVGWDGEKWKSWSK